MGRGVLHFSITSSMVKQILVLLVLHLTVSVHGDTITLADIQKAIHGLGGMMEKTWHHGSSEERKPIFDLYTCLSLSKDLELLVFNRTEIFIEDQRQTCSCRRVHGQLETQGGSLSEDSTFNTDLFIRVLIKIISDYEDSQTLSQIFTHFNHEWLNTRKNDSHVHELRDILVKLTPVENAIQIMTRFLVKRWAIEVIKDLNVPIFELYTCTSLLQQVEVFIQTHPGALNKLDISKEKEWYVPCFCNRLNELALANCITPKLCSYNFNAIHTAYEEKVHKLSTNMALPPELSF